MKQIQSVAYNITEDIVGRITFGNSNPFTRSKDILIGKNIDRFPYGYMSVISTNTTYVDKQKPYCLVDSIEDFHEGDVVVINKNGDIVFLYEIASRHNAIMATERCNHRCIMCPQPPIQQEKDRTSFNLELISLFDKKTQEIGITGGEPTLIGDNLFTIIKHIQKELPNTAISILSNGVKFADKEYAMKLAMCHHRDLQVDIPLFSDIADEHNRIVGANTFYKTVAGLYNLALFHIRIGIRIVVHRQTYRRLPQFAEFIYRNFPFVSQVAFMQMETIGLAKENFEELWIDPYDYNEQLREAVLLLADRRMNPYIYNAQLCILPKDIRQYAQQSISDWKDIYLPECEGCVLRGKCAGFFESNKVHHSRHIKPFINIPVYTPMPIPIDGNITISDFIKKNLTCELLNNYTNPIIYDVPCGYGRHLQWLSNLGYEVHGVDLDPKCLDYLEQWKDKQNKEDVYLHKKNINELETIACCDILLNIHLYSRNILTVLSKMVKQNGLIIIETPEIGHGDNYMELPMLGEIREVLESNHYKILLYNESSSHKGYVSVKTIAKKWYKPLVNLLFNLKKEVA